MKKIFFLILLSLLLLPFGKVKAAYQCDLGISSTELSYSVNEFVVGEPFRIYATIRNYGSKDAVGMVSFFQGSLPMDKPQVISVRANGVEEEVFIDWVVPESSFNIRVLVSNVEPIDEDLSNNQIITKMYQPKSDLDQDRVPDYKDNCKDISNLGQEDQDGDNIGDACDNDNNNNGIPDEEENREDEKEELEEPQDIENSGIHQEDQEQPTLPRSDNKTPSSINYPPQNNNPIKDNTSKNLKTTGLELFKKLFTNNLEEPEEDVKEIVENSVKIYYKKTGENKYFFQALGMEKNNAYQYNWYLGDNIKKSGEEIEHQFNNDKMRKIIVTVSDLDEILSSDEVIINMPEEKNNLIFRYGRYAFGLIVMGGLLYLTIRLKNKM